MHACVHVHVSKCASLRKAEVRHVYDEQRMFLARSYTNEYGCFHGVQPGLSLTYSPQQSCNWYTREKEGACVHAPFSWLVEGAIHQPCTLFFSVCTNYNFAVESMLNSNQVAHHESNHIHLYSFSPKTFLLHHKHALLQPSLHTVGCAPTTCASQA